MNANVDLTQNLTVTVTSPDGQDQLVLNTTDAHAATIGAVPSAIGPIQVTWSRPSARDHCDPSTASLTLILDTETHPVLRWDSHVLITTDVSMWLPDGGRVIESDVVVWRGWIDTLTRSRRIVRHPSTGVEVITWSHEMTMFDLIGRAQSTKVGDTPWPLETTPSRLARIEAVAPFPLLDPGAPGYSWMLAEHAPRDMDNQELLAPLRDAAGGFLAFIHDTPDGLQLRPMPGNELADAWQAPLLPWQESRPIVLDAWELTDAPRKVDRSARVTQVTIGYTVLDAEDEPQETSLVVRDPAAQTSAEVKITSDHVDSGLLPPMADVRLWAESLVTMTRDPISVLDPVQVVLPALRYPTADPESGRESDLYQLARMIGLGERSNLLMRIAGAPVEVGEWHHILGGELTINHDRTFYRADLGYGDEGRLTSPQSTLTLTLAPTQLAGQRPLTWDDIPAEFPNGSTGTWNYVGDFPYPTWTVNTVSTIPTGVGP